jgi:acyl-CoA thioesterase I
MEFIRKLARKNENYTTAEPLCAAFLGDSVTHGVFEIHAAVGDGIGIVLDYEAVYHAQWRNLLNGVYPNAPIHIINAGISGSSAADGLIRLDRDVLRYSPDLVVVCFGLNDVNGGMEKLEEYGHTLECIFRRLMERGVETIFMTPNMLNTRVSPLTVPASVVDYAAITAQMQNDGRMDAYMERARVAAQACGVPLCDCYRKWKKFQAEGVDTTALLSNHINHPTRQLHKLFANALFDLMMFD